MELPLLGEPVVVRREPLPQGGSFLALRADGLRGQAVAGNRRPDATEALGLDSPAGEGLGLHGWRFQDTDEAGFSLIFDVHKGEDDWHVRRAYDY